MKVWYAQHNQLHSMYDIRYARWRLKSPNRCVLLFVNLVWLGLRGMKYVRVSGGVHSKQPVAADHLVLDIEPGAGYEQHTVACSARLRGQPTLMRCK